MAQYKGAASEAGRAMQLMKKREKEREQLEQLKQKIAEDNMVKSNIDKKFSAHYDAVEAELKSSTVGLVTLNDMKAKQEALVKEREKQLAKKEQSKELQLKLEKQKEKKRKEEQKRKIASLSFNPEDEGEEEEEEENEDEELDYSPARKKYLGKNPDVDTSFLPDRDREEEENRLREELRQEWELKQEKIKSEEIEITFSYWDGSGHRKTVKMKKGNTIQNFLQRALEVLRKDFSELSILYGSSTNIINKLQYIQNSAGRLLSHSTRDRITPVLQNLQMQLKLLFETKPTHITERHRHTCQNSLSYTHTHCVSLLPLQ
ncbi:protein FAM50A isoform X2 [Anarhichas minor]|uniref:protein FAM50A isoform X2 n=1 Tax=Anarhichas minor TaxID=65739 RepID=UPI003F73C43E